MENAPKRIWANANTYGDAMPLCGEWNHCDVGSDEDTEYAPTDLVKPLIEALKDLRSDLFYQIEAKHGPRAASEYPSIVAAQNAIAEWESTNV